MIVFPFDTYSAFCVLQSRLHEVWCRWFGSTLEDRLRYTPSDCFETFPFPNEWSSNPRLEEAGGAYYEFRATLIQQRNEGLTKTYNRFHDRYENDPHIIRLRELHAAMDKAVLKEYGWDDIPTKCEFLSDHESEDGSSSKRFWRYRWPNDVQDRMLGRLIDLNAQRAREEREAEESKAFEFRTLSQAPRMSKAEEEPDESSYLVPPPLFADQDD